MQGFCQWILAVGMMAAGLGLAQAQEQTQPSAQPAARPSAAYQPKFAGDPARSEAEAQALGYMRTVLRAQHAYKKRHGVYAESLAALAGTGSLTKRMAHTTDRGDYTAGFRPHRGGFALTMTPKRMDGEHRSFYAEEDGAIHADDQKPADLDSPKVQ
jgi:hypothetical protein